LHSSSGIQDGLAILLQAAEIAVASLFFDHFPWPKLPLLEDFIEGLEKLPVHIRKAQGRLGLSGEIHPALAGNCIQILGNLSFFYYPEK
jgi:hypothetical protein